MFKTLDFDAFLTCPLDPTSKETRRHLKPLSSKSLFNAVYLNVFLKFAAPAFR